MERRMRAGGADSLDTRQTESIPASGRSNGDGQRVRSVDGKLRSLARERLAWAAPLALAGSLLALAAADLANVAAPIQLMLVLIAAGALLAIRSEEGALRTELRQARVTAVDAVDIERSRVEHDLHDSVQQRLIGIRIRLDDLMELAPRDDVREAIERLGGELDATLADIRSVTLGSAPEVLHMRGLRDALHDACVRAPLGISLEFRAARRYPPDVERCVYFCCLEALQNVLKHAGSKARAWIRVAEQRGRLTFEVEDSGVGFDPGRIQTGRGITSLTDRIGALNGRLRIDTRPGFGTRVRGEIPLD
jgi:signal transduction histidine kinase